MSVSQNFPNIFPSMSMDFANVEALDPRITYARASTATYYGTRTALAEQNLLVQSQLFATTWILSNVAATENATTAPDSTVTAASIIPSATSAAHIQAKNISSATGVFTYSLYAKANGYNYLQLFWNSGSDYANFFLSGGGSVSQSSGVAAVITSVGNGWYRCSITSTVSAYTQVYFGAMVTGTEARAASYTGDGTSGIFVWGAQLEQRSTVTAYTPTTTQPITNYVPVLETAASGVARFDHNPTTFESLGLEIEEQRTNLVLYSADYSNAVWGVNNLTVSSNVNIAPDSTQTADALVESTGSVSPAIYFTTGISLTSGTAYTGSVYLKANGRNFVAVYFQSANFPDSGRIAWFDLSTQTTQFQSGVTGTITSVGNGWYRCTITATADATGNTSTNSLGVLIAPALGSTAAYTGNGFSGLFIWGAQLEAGAFATSYIPTVASQVTRAADSALMTGTNFSEWYRADEGTLYAEGLPATNASGLLSIEDGSASNRMQLRGNSLVVVTNGSVVVALSNSLVPALVSRKIVAFYKTNDFALCVNSEVPSSDTTGTLPLVNRIIIGGGNTQSTLNGTIKKIAYYPILLSNTNLVALTG